MHIRSMTRWLTLAAMAGCAGASVAAEGPSEEALGVDGYAAMVNDRVILQSEVDAASIPLLRNLARTLEARLRELQLSEGQEPDLEAQKEITEEFNARAEVERTRALEYLIERHLIVEEFERNGGELPDRVVNDHIQRVIDDNFNGDRSQLLDQLRQDQMSFEEFKAQRRDDLIATLLQQQELRNLPSVAPQEVYALYQARGERYREPAEVRLSGITISQGETDAERATKRDFAEGLRRRLLDGEDFAELARAHSEGRRASTGGDWGWRVAEDSQPAMAKAIEKTPTTGITDLIEIETDEGDWLFYILRVEARKDPAVTAFEQVRDDLRAELEEKAREATYRAWIERLKKHHYVQIF